MSREVKRCNWPKHDSLYIEYHDKEFDKVTWKSFETAKTLLTYKNELNVLEKAIEIVSSK